METQAARNDERLPSLREIGVAKLRALGRALELREDVIRSAVEVFDLMSFPWAELSVGDRPPWPNDITDDGTPFEFSVALDGIGCELRMLLESQSLPATATSSWDAGLALQARLRDAGLVSLQRFQQVQDIFCPLPQTETHFSLWHAAVLTDSSGPLFKSYLNPAILGRGSAPRLVRQALGRLGLESAWEFLDQRLQQFATPDIRYFALDLDDAESARVKVYVGSSESADEVEGLLDGVANFAPGRVTEWLSALTGRTGPFPARPILCCFAFTSGKALPTATLHVPIRCYVDDDEQAARRVTSLLSSDAERRLMRALTAAANRPLRVGRGLLTYASLRPAPDRLRVTVYLAPETYAIAAPRRVIKAVDSVPVRSIAVDETPNLRAITTLSDIRVEIADRARSFGRHSLFALIGDVDAGRVVAILPRMALLAMFLRDALRVSMSHFEDAVLAAAVVDDEFDRVVTLLQREARDRIPNGDASWPFADESETARDWAYVQVGQLLSPADDHARLAAAWSVAGLLGMLCNRTLIRLLGDGLAALASPPAREPEIGFELAVPRASSRGALESIERVTAAMVRLATDLEGLLRSSPAIAESAAFPVGGGELPRWRLRGGR